MKKSKLILFLFMMFSFYNNSYCQLKEIHKSTNFVLNDSCVLLVTISTFDSSMNKIEKCKVLNWEGVCLINGGLVFGTDFEVPKTVLDEMDLYIKDIKIELDISCMYNPNGLNLIPDKGQFKIRETEGGIVLTGDFSDGAGSYTAIWKIVKDNSLRVFIGKPCSQ